MAGLLFLFLMQAMDESFKKQCALPEPEFRTHRDSKRGRLLKQPAPAKTKGVPFHFGKSMFADDAAYILSSRQELEMLCAAIFHHMRHFGLLMHAGTLDENGNHQTKSKTEAMFIPAHPMTQEDIDAATTDIVFGTQYVPFTQEFQYLGSRVTTDLKDVTDINN
jgi:hypothetical protein